jgi:hypothetical protein
MRISRQHFSVQAMLDQKQLEKVEYFNYLRSVITNDVRCTREIKPRIAMVKEAFNKKKTLYTGKLNLNFRKN